MLDFSQLKQLFRESKHTYVDIEKRARRYEKLGCYIEIIAIWCDGICRRKEREISGERVKTDVTLFVRSLEECIQKAIEKYQEYPVQKDIKGAIEELGKKKDHLERSASQLKKYGVEEPLIGILKVKVDHALETYNSIWKGIQSFQDSRIRSALNELGTIKDSHPMAKEYFQKAMASDKEAQTLFTNALRFLNENKVEDAKREFGRAQKLNRESEYVQEIPEMMRRRSEALQRISKARLQYQTGDLEQSYSTLQEALQIDQGCDTEGFYDEVRSQVVTTHYDRGLEYQVNRDLDGAVREYEFVRHTGIEFKDAAKRLKELQKEKKKLETLESRITRFMEEGNPVRTLEAFESYASSEYKMKRLDILYREVHEAVEKGQRLKQDGENYLKKKDYGKARECFKELKANFPKWDNVDALLSQAEINHRAESLQTQAESLIQKKELRSALELLEQIETQAENYPEVEERMGSLAELLADSDKKLKEAVKLYEKGDLQEAQKIIETVVEMIPTDRGVLDVSQKIDRAIRAESCFEEAKFLKEKDKQILKALEKAEEARSLRSDDKQYQELCEEIGGIVNELESLYQKGQDLRDSGELEESIRKFEALVDKRYPYKDSEEQLSLWKKQMEQIEVDLYPKAEKAHREGDLTKSRELLDQILKMYPEHEQALAMERIVVDEQRVKDGLEKVRDLQEKGDLKTALIDIQKVLKIDPSSREASELASGIKAAFLNDALTGIDQLVKDRKVNSALDRLAGLQELLPEEESVKRKTDEIETIRRMALQCYNQGKGKLEKYEFDTAEALFRKALEINEELSIVKKSLEEIPEKRKGWGLYLEGKRAEDSGNYPKAVDLYKEALKILPDSEEAHNAVENVQAQLGISGKFGIELEDRIIIQVLPLKTVKIGRNSTEVTNDIVFEQKCISRNSGRIERLGKEWVIHKTGRGALVYQQNAISEKAIHHNDVLEIWTLDEDDEIVERVAELRFFVPEESREKEKKRDALKMGKEIGREGGKEVPSLVVHTKEFRFDIANQKVDPSPPYAGENDYIIIGSQILVGKGDSNELILEGDTISKTHAKIFLKNKRFWIRDLGSQNGTYMNGELLEVEAILKFGDKISFGKTGITIVELE